MTSWLGGVWVSELLGRLHTTLHGKPEEEHPRRRWRAMSRRDELWRAGGSSSSTRWGGSRPSACRGSVRNMRAFARGATHPGSVLSRPGHPSARSPASTASLFGTRMVLSPNPKGRSRHTLSFTLWKKRPFPSAVRAQGRSSPGFGGGAWGGNLQVWAGGNRGAVSCEAGSGDQHP